MSELRSSPAPAWYPDPEQDGKERYWSGSAWTDHRRPAGAGEPPAGPAGSTAAPAASRSGNVGGYTTTTAKRPGLIHSIILLVASLVVTPWLLLPFAAVIVAAVSTFHAYKAGQATNRGEFAQAEQAAVRARRWRVITYIVLPVTVVMGAVFAAAFVLMMLS